MNNNYSLDSLRGACKQKNGMFNNLMGLLDYFRILKAFIILFLLFICMNYVLNQNGKVLGETLAGFNLDHVKTKLRRLRCFKMTLPLLQVLQKSLPIPLSLCYTRQRVL